MLQANHIKFEIKKALKVTSAALPKYDVSVLHKGQGFTFATCAPSHRNFLDIPQLLVDGRRKRLYNLQGVGKTHQEGEDQGSAVPKKSFEPPIHRQSESTT